jgi:K+-transporting ATPase ATPase B chain
MTRGSITTFSVVTDFAKYFTILPAIFAATLPAVSKLDFISLQSPDSAILSAVIFNTFVILALIPLAMRGVKYKPKDATSTLIRNVAVYGIGGLLTPFIAIKAIDLLVNYLHIVG